MNEIGDRNSLREGAARVLDSRAGEKRMADVTIKLTVGTFSVEVAGEQAYVDAKFEELVSRFLSSRRVQAVESSSFAAPEQDGGKKTSAAEFLKRGNFKNQSDRALGLGFYLEKFERRTSFTSTELAQLGKETKQPFANASDSVAKLTSRGLMMSAGDKDGQRAYALTASGETYVEGLLLTEQ